MRRRGPDAARRGLLRRRQSEALSATCWPCTTRASGSTSRSWSSGCKQEGEFEAIGGAAYLAEVAQSVPTPPTPSTTPRSSASKATLRELIHASTEILRDAWDPTHRGPRAAQPGGREDFRRPRPPQQRPGDQHPRPAGRGLRADRRPAGARRGGAGIPTGFRDLDTLTGGLHDSEFVDPGRPAEHGQDRLGHEHRRARGDRRRRAGVVRQPGNGPAGAGPAAFVLARGASTPTSSAAASFPARTARSWSRRRPSWARPRFSSTTRPAAR